MTVRINRIYVEQTLTVGSQVELPADAVRHLSTVLKVNAGDDVILFNGDGYRYLSTLTTVEKKRITATINKRHKESTESPLHIHLVQSVSRGDKMDLTLQKGVELGVNEFTPLFTERCGVKLDAKRLEKKMTHWRKVIISACEQCGRDVVPVLHEPVTFEQWVSSSTIDHNTLVLNPHSGESVNSLKESSTFHLVTGPEGGLSDKEIERLVNQGASSIQLGPRILRTETAGWVMVSLLQGRFGDF